MFPISSTQLDTVSRRVGIHDVNTATIRQIVSLASALEAETSDRVLHLELGNPGISAPEIGIEAECEALHGGVAWHYPDIAGLPKLKKAGERFLKAFVDIDVSARNIVPTVGSMQGCFTTMLLLGQRTPGKDTILFINPGFPAQRNQAKVLGLGIESFDIYDYRGAALEEKLESYLSKGNISGILYCNPNNPAWINLTEQELEIIGRMATRYDAIVIEDMAYLGMDFRCDFSHPNAAPYIPTVARYTDNYIIMLSASKIFSYAGQRIALVCIGDELGARHFPYLEQFYNMPTYTDAYIYGVLYCASSGTSHSAQHAMAAMLEAAVDERLDFVAECREYERRSRLVRKAFLDNGFSLVYDRDGEREISDGFFFTVRYGHMTGADLQRALMAYGIATIPLASTGSEQEGVRVCVSTMAEAADFELLERRLHQFHTQNSVS